MKLLLLSAFCVLSVGVLAQVPKKTNPYSFQLPDTLKRFKGSGNEAFEQLLHDYFQKKQSQNNLVGNKRGNIAILPQDHMPCLVPQIDMAAKIPNAWPEVTIPFTTPNNPIPNPALPKVQSLKMNAADNGLGIPSK